MTTKHATLTDAELEIMHILWEHGEANVKTVQRALPQERALAYTTISTLLRILVKKEFCRIREEGRGHVYIPNISREEYEESSLHRMVDQVFLGRTSQLVKHLVSLSRLSPEDRDALYHILENKK